MSTHLKANPLSYKAGGAISKGHAVKIGADRLSVVKCSSATDKSIGVAMMPVSADEATSGAFVEVAKPGGGAKGLAGGSISAGDLLTSDSNGALIATTTANNRVVGVADEDAVAGDLFAMTVQLSNV